MLADQSADHACQVTLSSSPVVAHRRTKELEASVAPQCVLPDPACLSSWSPQHSQHTCVGGGRSVSTRVSPVELVGCIPTGHRTVATASCPRATALPLVGEGGRRGVLPFRGGTLCLAARGLSPGGLICSDAKCSWRGCPRQACHGLHRGGPSCCALTWGRAALH